MSSMFGLCGILVNLLLIGRKPPHRPQHYRTILKTRPSSMIPENGPKVARYVEVLVQGPDQGFRFSVKLTPPLSVPFN